MTITKEYMVLSTIAIQQMSFYMYVYMYTHTYKCTYIHVHIIHKMYIYTHIPVPIHNTCCTCYNPQTTCTYNIIGYHHFLEKC